MIVFFCLYLLGRFPSQKLRHVFMLTLYILLKNYVTCSCWRFTSLLKIYVTCSCWRLHPFSRITSSVHVGVLHPFSRITSSVHVDVLHPFSRITSSVHVGWKALWSSFCVTLSFHLQPSNVKSPPPATWRSPKLGSECVKFVRTYHSTIYSRHFY